MTFGPMSDLSKTCLLTHRQIGLLVYDVTLLVPLKIQNLYTASSVSSTATESGEMHDTLVTEDW